MPREKRTGLEKDGEKLGLSCRACGYQHLPVVYVKLAEERRLAAKGVLKLQGAICHARKHVVILSPDTNGVAGARLRSIRCAGTPPATWRTIN